MLSETLTKKLTLILLNAGCSECFLFGSHVTGSSNEDSDIDIGVRGLAPNKFFIVLAQLQEVAGVSVDLVDFDEKPKFYSLLRDLGELKKLG